MNTILARLARAMARRAEYNRLVTEIEGMSQRDLVEVGAFKEDLLRGAYEQVYGKPA